MECAVLKQIESYMAACRLDEFLQDTELTQERITAPLKEKSLSMESFYAFLFTTLAQYYQQCGTLEGAKNRLVMTAEKCRSVTDSHKRNDFSNQTHLPCRCGCHDCQGIQRRFLVDQG